MYQISDTTSLWKCIRLELVEVKVREFKTIMRDTVRSTNSLAITTNQPKDVSLYKIEQHEPLFIGTADNMCKYLSQLLDLQ